MPNNYQFLDAYGSVLTAESSIIGSAHRPIVNVGSVLFAVPVVFSGNTSVSGTVGASIIGAVNTNPGSVLVLNPVSTLAVNPNPASVQVLNPVSVLAVTQSGAWSASLVGTIPGSTVAFQGTPEWTVKSSVAGGIFPVSGSVAATVTNNVTVVSSIAGGIFPISGSVAATITNTNLNVSGSVVAFPGTNPWPVVGVGSIITIAQSSVATVIIGGSIATATTNSSVMLLNSAN